MSKLKKNFRIKTEVAFALSQFSIDAEFLNFLPDDLVHFEKLNSENRLEIVLVDHNNRVAALEKFTDRIILVLDHHKMIEPTTLPPGCNVVIKMVGSCASVVQNWAKNELKISGTIKKVFLMSQKLLLTMNFARKKCLFI